MRVRFFLPGEKDLAALAELDPDREPRHFMRGERAWTLQTWRRLHDAGHPVELGDELPESGLAVFHVKHRREVMRRWGRSSRAVLVGIRADNSRSSIVDFEVLQNDRHAAPGRRFFVPFWPQPGILPRDPARGAEIRRAAYRGFSANLDPRFLDDEFRQALARLGVDWLVDAVAYAGGSTDERSTAWHDYREVDLVLAVRPPARHLHTGKPATKLYNAWHAGVPCLLGPEYAFRALRRGPLDYLEVTSPDSALAAIAELRAAPERYLAMVENGRRRALDFTVQAIAGRWAELLFTTLPPLGEATRVRRWRGRPLALKRVWRGLLER